MKANVFIAALFLFCLGCTSREAKQKPVSWSDPAAHKSGFVTANGVRLHYLDWGGTGPVLILIHGYADNPHVFDDLAPAFTDHYRVVAYARRGHGQSDTTGPYNLTTLTDDLRGLMDALNISKAHLAGWSMGGNEITAMAGKYSDRVNSITYLEAAYDWSDPAMAEAFKNGPAFYMAPPAGAMTSLDAWRAYQMIATFPGISDTSRFEAYIRDLINIQPDGSVQPRMSDSVSQSLVASLFTSQRNYRKVSVPVLAIYAETMFDVHNADTAVSVPTVAWENKHMAPFRKASIERIRKELPKAEILSVPGTHMNFVFKSRQQVVEAMLHFLSRQGI